MLLAWRLSLVSLEAIAISLEAIAVSLEAIAIRLEAIVSRIYERVDDTTYLEVLQRDPQGHSSGSPEYSRFFSLFFVVVWPDCSLLHFRLDAIQACKVHVTATFGRSCPSARADCFKPPVRRHNSGLPALGRKREQVPQSSCAQKRRDLLKYKSAHDDQHAANFVVLETPNSFCCK